MAKINQKNIEGLNFQDIYIDAMIDGKCKIISADDDTVGIYHSKLRETSLALCPELHQDLLECIQVLKECRGEIPKDVLGRFKNPVWERVNTLLKRVAPEYFPAKVVTENDQN